MAASLPFFHNNNLNFSLQDQFLVQRPQTAVGKEGCKKSISLLNSNCYLINIEVFWEAHPQKQVLPLYNIYILLRFSYYTTTHYQTWARHRHSTAKKEHNVSKYSSLLLPKLVMRTQMNQWASVHFTFIHARQTKDLWTTVGTKPMTYAQVLLLP